MTSADIRQALRAKYPAPEYAFLWEVANGTGGTARRSADGIAMGLWPSRGMEIEGFEIKVSRSDWTRELKNPQKAEEIARFCNRWWIVAPELIVQEHELPAGWGLQIFDFKSGKLRVAKAAPALEAVPPTRHFVAAILRRACEQVVPDVQIKAECEAAYRRGSEAQAKLSEGSLQRTRDELATLWAQVRAFESASGVHIGHGDPQKIGDAVRQVISGDRSIKLLRQRIGDLKKNLEFEVTRLASVLNQIPEELEAQA